MLSSGWFHICACEPDPSPIALFSILCPLPCRQVVGGQLGGHKLSDDVWFLNTRYHTAVVHQKEAWFEVEAKLRDVFIKVIQI